MARDPLAALGPDPMALVYASLSGVDTARARTVSKTWKNLNTTVNATRTNPGRRQQADVRAALEQGAQYVRDGKGLMSVGVRPAGDLAQFLPFQQWPTDGGA